MNKYVVAFLSLHEGELKQEIVEANSKLESALSYLEYDKDSYSSLNVLIIDLYDLDIYLNVLDISNSRTGWSVTGLQTHEAQFNSVESFH